MCLLVSYERISRALRKLDRGPVQTNPDIFENTVFFLREL